MALISVLAEGRDNNFNLLRFVCAVLVLYSHSFALVIGSGEAEPLRSSIGMTWGTIAVDIFFITSGFLITKSYCKSASLIEFAWARFLRIFPALIIAVLIFVFGVGIYFTVLPLSDYLLHPQIYKYILKTSTLFFGVEHTLPGVFDDVPYRNAINGSLWTLPYEIKMYVIIAIVISLSSFSVTMFKIFSAKNVVGLIAIMSLGFNIIDHFSGFFSGHFIRLLSMFFIGSMFYMFRDVVFVNTRLFVILMFSVLISLLSLDCFFVVYVLVIPFLVFYISYIPDGFFRKFNSYGDYSYGLYIYAFPVQQSLIATFPNISISAMIVSSFVVTFFISFLSWHLIEKKCLSMKRIYTTRYFST